MGIVHRGIPHRLAISISESVGAEWFIETGTHMGESAKFARQWFKKVLTIESVKHYHDKAIKRLAPLGIECYLGDSPEVLARLVPQIFNIGLFWLDAHWSPDLNAPRPNVICPVLEEIKIINLSTFNHAIMVDDARLFGYTLGWPNKATVMEALADDGRRMVYEEDDVVCAIPTGRSVGVEEI